MTSSSLQAALRIWAGCLSGLGLGGLPLSATPALVRHAPSISGTVDGSIQQLQAENVTLNGAARITGDLLLPGSPTVRLNGRPKFAGTIDGPGSASPAGYRVTLNGAAGLRHVVRRTDPVSLPAPLELPPPSGSRQVVISAPGQNPGDFATLRDLTLNGPAAQVSLPPGSYGSLTANGGGRVTLGVAGASEPAAYTFQKIVLNGQAELQVAGPVIVTVAGAVALNGRAGSSLYPSWLTLHIVSGGLTVNGGSTFYGYANASNGAVVINGAGSITGGVACDRLIINGKGLLRLVPPPPNQPPQVALTFPVAGMVFMAPAALALAANAVDPDGRIARVEFYRDGAKLGAATVAPYEWHLSTLPAGAHTFVARAVDDRNAWAESEPVTIMVAGNQPPTASLTSPPNGAVFMAPANVLVGATANDVDGTVVKVEFYHGDIRFAEDYFPPYEAALDGLPAGTHVFQARAFDNLGAWADSPTSAIVVQAPNVPPSVELIAPPDGATFTAPASFTLIASASDFDGSIALVEFFQGATRLGQREAAPYELNVFALPPGSHHFSVRAHDNGGAVTTSATLTVNVTAPNQPPVVALTSPAAGALFAVPANLLLSAVASDLDGVVTRVEFFQGAAKLGEVESAPFTFIWPNVSPGAYSLTARAHDNDGASTMSAAHAVAVAIGLPYFTGFEAGDGFAPGVLDGQAGWRSTGTVTVSDNPVYQGSQAVLLAGGHRSPTAAQTFAGFAGQTIGFVDFFCQPAVESGAAAATAFVETRASRVAFVQTGTSGELHVFDGDGLGGGAWRATGFLAPLNAGGQADDWLRLTLREDYGAKLWDLYANGRLIACDLGFVSSTAMGVGQFIILGHETSATGIDDFFAGFDNPLFVDADRDGMEDAWETAHGLDPAANDRNGDLDGDGLSNLREYLLALRPDRASTFDDGISDGVRVSQGLSLTEPTFDQTPPTPPTALAAVAANLNVTLSWSASTDNLGVAGYHVFRGSELLNAISTPGTSYSDTVPEAGTLYEYTVRAIDLAGNVSAPGNVVRVGIPGGDSDGSGMPDDWQLLHFGRLGVAPDGDDDGDGMTNLNEFQNGSDPTDFYNGMLPTVAALESGLPSPEGVLGLRVTRPDGTVWANAPITFGITSGYNRLSSTPERLEFRTSVEVRTDADGIARAYLEIFP